MPQCPVQGGGQDQLRTIIVDVVNMTESQIIWEMGLCTYPSGLILVTFIDTGGLTLIARGTFPGQGDSGLGKMETES